MEKLIFLLCYVLGAVLIQVNCQLSNNKNDQISLLAPSRQSYPCDVGCADCGTLRLFCKRCQYGYQPRGAGCTSIKVNKQKTCTILPHCLECPKNKVSIFYSCQKCENGYYPVDSTMGTYCVRSCPKGYQLKNAAIGQMCQQMPTQCPRMPGCVDCPTSYTCRRCAGNLILYDGLIESECKKTCPASYTMQFKNGVRVCQQEAGCYDRKCHSCKNGWVRAEYNGKFCHRKCPPGYKKIFGNFCMKCSQGCQTCDNTGCLVCNRGLSLYRDDIWNFTVCRKTCPKGHISVAVRGKGNQCHKVSQQKPNLLSILLP